MCCPLCVHLTWHRARAFAKKLNDAPLAIVDKRRSAHNVSEVMNLIGDVRGKVAVLVDDMIDTAGTITNAAKVLRQEGAREVSTCEASVNTYRGGVVCVGWRGFACSANVVSFWIPRISFSGYCSE